MFSTHGPRVSGMLSVFLTSCAHATSAAEPAAPQETVRWFQATEQALMDAVGVGDKSAWERVMDPACVVTSEEGQILNKSEFLEELGPLPPGLTGGIAVKELTVLEFPGFAVVRYLADEWESVFGQKLATSYRVTDTFRRDGKNWRMVASHFAVVTRDPPPQPSSSSAWPDFAGTYQLVPDGWTFHVDLRDGVLYGGRNPQKLKPFIPLTSDAFVLSGSLGEWIFVSNEKGKVTRILNLRKFEPLVWTRVEGKTPVAQ